jgi:hypothetical protein
MVPSSWHSGSLHRWVQVHSGAVFAQREFLAYT